MSLKPVEWVLVIFYGKAAHKAVYGRQAKGSGYTKDYIQLTKQFLTDAEKLFPAAGVETDSIPITYHWPSDQTSGAFVFQSADRPHLKWETSLGAPEVWKMTPRPTPLTIQTIPGDPSHDEGSKADQEFDRIEQRGAGQPFLLAIKLLGESRRLHLRTYLKAPKKSYAWAALDLLPHEVQILASATSARKALARNFFDSSGVFLDADSIALLQQVAVAPDLTAAMNDLSVQVRNRLSKYLLNPGKGLFFNPEKGHDAWARALPMPDKVALRATQLLQLLSNRSVRHQEGDAAAEAFDTDAEEIRTFRKQIECGNYVVEDATSNRKIRGSAQKVFADKVKAIYGGRCAIVGIATKDFLVASHIVPWSDDPSIRLDPSNGICLSMLMDRAFEKGYILIDDDLTIRVDWGKVGGDKRLAKQLAPYEAKKLNTPSKHSPRPEYLQRRRKLVE